MELQGEAEANVRQLEAGWSAQIKYLTQEKPRPHTSPLPQLRPQPTDELMSIDLLRPLVPLNLIYLT